MKSSPPLASPLVIADPDFDLGTTKRVNTQVHQYPASRLERLAGAAKEGNIVAAILGVEVSVRFC